MHQFASGALTKIFSLALSILVIGINIFFVLQYVLGLGYSAWYFYFFIIFVGILYLMFCLYLITDMAINMGAVGILRTPLGSLFAHPDETYEMYDDNRIGQD